MLLRVILIIEYFIALYLIFLIIGYVTEPERVNFLSGAVVVWAITRCIYHTQGVVAVIFLTTKSLKKPKNYVLYLLHPAKVWLFYYELKAIVLHIAYLKKLRKVEGEWKTEVEEDKLLQYLTKLSKYATDKSNLSKVTKLKKDLQAKLDKLSLFDSFEEDDES